MTKNRHHILWILILAATLRWIQIDAPPVGRHAWRQSDTASVARNFHHNGYRLFYPQIDWEDPGFVEMEFPIFPWTTSLLYSFLGESEAIARALAILGSLATLGFLYLLIQRILGRRAALWSAALYAILPANIFFGRAIMPESWMLAASVAGLYWFSRWIDEDAWPLYGLALFAITFACLLKLTSLYLGLPLLWLAQRKWGRKTLGRWQLWLFAVLVTIPLLLWYGHAYRLGQEFGASFHILTAAGADKWGTWHLLVDPGFYNRVFVGYLGGRMLTWVGLPIFLVGIFLPRSSPRERLLDVWLLAVITVLLLASGGSFQHDYYSLPLLLPAAAFMGKAFDRGWESRKRWLVAAAVLMAVLSGYRHLGVLAEEHRTGADSIIAEALALETAPGDPVISCNGANPVWLYLSNRRGWGRDCERIGKAGLRALIDSGARYLVARGTNSTASATGPRINSHLRMVHDVRRDDETMLLVQLTSPRRFQDLSWDTVMLEEFGATESLESWDLQGGSWSIVDGSLVGTRAREHAEARSLTTVPPCQTCRVRMSLSLVRPPALDTDPDRALRHRGSGRATSRASIDLWRQGQGPAVTLALSTNNVGIGLLQTENGTRIDSRRIDFSLIEEQPLSVEVRADGFELELLVDGRSVLTTPNRLTWPLAGRLAIRPQLGSIRLYRIEVQTPATPAPPPGSLQ